MKVLTGSLISANAPVIMHLVFSDDNFLFFRANTEKATAVKELLNEYERLSCQSVNFQKLGVFYRTNVILRKRNELSTVLGVSNDLYTGKYLGLPSLICRSKKRVFGFVKNKSGRGSKVGNQSPSRVLVRWNVAQSIPSYYMPCFLLQKTLCQEIERKKIWWNTGNMQEELLICKL